MGPAPACHAFCGLLPCGRDRAPRPGGQVAVEVQLPNHLTRNTHQPLGRGVYRGACLRAWGYAVVELCCHDWAALAPVHAHGARAEREAFLRRLLAGALGGWPAPAAHARADDPALQRPRARGGGAPAQGAPAWARGGAGAAHKRDAWPAPSDALGAWWEADEERGAASTVGAGSSGERR